MDDVRKELKITGSISLNDTKVRELAGKQIIPIFKFTNESNYPESVTILSKNKDNNFSTMKIGDPYYIKMGGDHSGGIDDYPLYNNGKQIDSITGTGYELEFTMENLINDIFLCNFGKTPSFSNNLQPTIPTISLRDFYGIKKIENFSVEFTVINFNNKYTNKKYPIITYPDYPENEASKGYIKYIGSIKEEDNGDIKSTSNIISCIYYPRYILYQNTDLVVPVVNMAMIFIFNNIKINNIKKITINNLSENGTLIFTTFEIRYNNRDTYVFSESPEVIGNKFHFSENNITIGSKIKIDFEF